MRAKGIAAEKPCLCYLGKNIDVEAGSPWSSLSTVSFRGDRCSLPRFSTARSWQAISHAIHLLQGIWYRSELPLWRKLTVNNRKPSSAGRHYSLVVERQPCKLKVLGSIPSGGCFWCSRGKTSMGPRGLSPVRRPGRPPLSPVLAERRDRVGKQA